jgi:hypothetical protein
MVQGQFSLIRGDAGYITAAGGAKVAIISKWVVAPSGVKSDGKPRLRFKAQFSWMNETLMNLKLNGMPMKKRIVVQMKTKYGPENVDILGWQEWRFEGGVLILEDLDHAEGVRVR